MKLLIILEELLPMVFWVLLIFGFDEPYVAILTVISALIHELGHLFALRALKKSRRLPRPDISGFRIEISNLSSLSYKEEMLCLIAGPTVNLVIGLFIPFFFSGEYAEVFSALNVMTALSNLLPVRGYDGYKFILNASKVYGKNPEKSEAVLEWLSFFFSAVMTFLSLYFILKIGEGYWIFAVFFSFLLTDILKRHNHAFFEKKRDFTRF